MLRPYHTIFRRPAQSARPDRALGRTHRLRAVPARAFAAFLVFVALRLLWKAPSGTVQLWLDSRTGQKAQPRPEAERS
jgi:hypothetical protein